MTVLDDRIPAPELGPDARRRLATALDRDGVVAAALIGSHARGTAGPLSDVDLAVWLDPGLDRATRDALHLGLARDAERALGHPAVDVVVLNDASPLLQHRARRDGERLVERDRATRVRLERDALLRFLDTAPLRETFARGRRRRLESGRYGRRG